MFITWQLVSTFWLIYEYTQGQHYLPDNKHLQNSELCMTENFIIHSKGTGKFHLEQTMKAQRVNMCIALGFL